MNFHGTAADVAVIVPTFNRLELLEETAASLQAQTLASARFVVVDDRSDDGATRSFLENLPRIDPRFELIEKTPSQERGCQTSRNIGLDNAQAGHVVFLDSDDLLSPECLEERLGFMRANPDADIVVGRQSIIDPSRKLEQWVNVPRPGVSDLDRFLQLTHPIDVPWVNGGVMIRTASLARTGVRWRPEFHWDDVAFHFECLAAGMKAVWMGNDRTPDSHYRAHAGPRYGEMLSSVPGIRSAARMIAWMHGVLDSKNEMTARRRELLMQDFFFACLLRAVDAGDPELSAELIGDACQSRLITGKEARDFRTYVRGRRILAPVDRATYFWNRFSEERLVPMHHPEAQSTYGTVPVELSNR